jgi:hypothetical protein
VIEFLIGLILGTMFGSTIKSLWKTFTKKKEAPSKNEEPQINPGPDNG